MAIANSNVDVDVQIAILEFSLRMKVIVLPYDLNQKLLVTLDCIIFLASIMHVVWSNYHELMIGTKIL